MKERRSTSRYHLARPVEIRIAPNLAEVGSSFVTTQDLSTHGFYFSIAQDFTIGTRFEFSIVLPIEVIGATQAYVSGKARVVRVEEAGESAPDRSGIGALIETFQISRGDSVKP